MAKKMKQQKKRVNRGGGNSAFAAAGPSCMMPSPTRKTYQFERTLYAGNLTAAVGDKGWAFSYTLGNFPGATELTQLFDLYRMRSMEVTFTLTTFGVYDPVLSMLADYDSFTVPATLDTIGQRPHKRVVLTSNQPSYTFKLHPRVMSVVQTSSGVGSSALAPAAQWMDCNDSTVVYGGLIGWISQFNQASAAAGTGVSVTTRCLFDFAMVR